MMKADRSDLKRRAPGRALGSGTTRQVDGARSFPGRDRMSQRVLSAGVNWRPRTDSRWSNEAKLLARREDVSQHWRVQAGKENPKKIC
jgi:hypothetical protein